MLKIQTYTFGLINTILGTFGQRNISAFTHRLLKYVVIGPIAEELAKVFSLKFGFGNIFMIYFNKIEFGYYVGRSNWSLGSVFGRTLTILSHYIYYISHKIADRQGKLLSYGAVFSHMFHNFLSYSKPYIEWTSKDGEIMRFKGTEEQLIQGHTACSFNAMMRTGTAEPPPSFSCSSLGMTFGEANKLRLSLPWRSTILPPTGREPVEKFLPGAKVINNMRNYLQDIFGNLFGCLNISQKLATDLSFYTAAKTISQPVAILTLPSSAKPIETKKQRGGKKSKSKKYKYKKNKHSRKKCNKRNKRSKTKYHKSHK
tara:strand:- start:96 stop:1037 length:942 start_codon:yes stop_codon:yes gene_type:complete